MKFILVCITIFTLQQARGAPHVALGSRVDTSQDQIQTIVSIHDRIQAEGFENVIKDAQWPKARIQLDNYGEDASGGFSDNPMDDCIFNPSMPGCPGAGTGDWSNPSTDPFGNPFGNSFGDPFGSSYGTSQTVLKNMQLKDDGVQILATEVLYQTLTFFKVKHVFGKIKVTTAGASTPATVWAFKVIDPKEGEPYQDLDSDTVLAAVKQFRKYVIGLLCNDPSPTRMLQLMNKFNVGTRFRWEMAWALLGNELPDNPNKYMRFGAKWRKFSLAMDGIQNGSMMRLTTAGGGYMPFDPTPFVPTEGPPVTPINPPSSTRTGKLAYTGYIANEVIGVIRLVGDIISATLDLFCKSDLSTNAKKEGDTQTAVYKLLTVKKGLYDHYAPLKSVLEEMGKKASQVSGKPVSFMP